MKRANTAAMRDTAHKGYLIRHNPIGDHWWIEKGGFRIGACKDLADGRRIIDEEL